MAVEVNKLTDGGFHHENLVLRLVSHLSRERSRAAAPGRSRQWPRACGWNCRAWPLVV